MRIKRCHNNVMICPLVTYDIPSGFYKCPHGGKIDLWMKFWKRNFTSKITYFSSLWSIVYYIYKQKGKNAQKAAYLTKNILKTTQFTKQIYNIYYHYVYLYIMHTNL